MDNTTGKTIDKIVVVMYFGLLLIDVANQLLLKIGRGFLVLLVQYLLCAYFMFFYGKKPFRRVKVHSFLIFLSFYIIEYQIFLTTNLSYNSFGVSFKIEVFQIVSLLPIVLSAIAILEKSDEDMINWMQKILIILLVCIGISSIFILSKDSDAAKLTATGLSNNYWFLIEYSTVYGLAVAFPCLLVWVKKSKRKTRKIVFICLMALCLFMASFLIALIAIILGIISYIFLNFKDKLIRYGLLFIFVGILVYIFVSGKLENFLLQLASMIPVENISLRLEELVEFFQTGDTEGGSVSRLQMYSNSIKGWLRHPIFGNILFNNDVILSGHSTNLDLLNACGIILFVPYIMFVINIFRFNRYKETKKKSAVIASFISFLFISTCNPVFSSPAIFVFYILGPTIFIGKTNLKERKICEPLK